MNTHIPFIINLAKHPQGYTFHSLEDTPNSLPKPKKNKPQPPKNQNSKLTNRLIKEIGLSGEIPPIIPQQNPYSKEINNQPDEYAKNEIEEPQEEEEIDCEVKRTLQLPPTPSKWFSLKQLHQIEIQHFPQFFSGKGYKTPQLYQAYRNFIVEAYLKNQKRYLTFVACRRVLKGDVNCILKIYKFLLDQGIINYGLNVDGNYSFTELPLGKALEISKKPQSCLKKMPEQSEHDSVNELDTDNLTVTVINKNFSRTYRVYCYRCKLICGVVWYTSAVEDDKSKSICIDCFNELDRQQALGFVKTDITKRMEINKQSRAQGKTNWGLDDNIKLLDFIGNSEGKNWNDILNQFEGKKSLEDIIIQFMQFPITNFDPHQQQVKLEHQAIDYPNQQHLRLLQKLYDDSVYSLKNEVKEQDKTKQNNPPPTLTAFKSLTSLILTKYSNKLDHLHSLQTIYQQTNLDVNEQIPVTRIRRVKQEDLQMGGAQENWDSENNQNNQYE